MSETLTEMTQSADNAAYADSGDAAAKEGAQGGVTQNTNENGGANAPDAQGKKEMTKSFSERLKKETAKLAEKHKEELEGYKKLEDALRQAGYEGENAREILDALNSEKEEKQLSDIKKSVESYKSAVRNSPAVEKAREVIRQNIFREDLNAIKSAYPLLEAQDVFDIGDVYTSIMSAGGVDALTAYEAQLAYDRRKKKHPPAEMGEINASASSGDTQYFSPQAVDKLTQKDFDRDPLLLNKVKKSMLKWK